MMVDIGSSSVVIVILVVESRAQGRLAPMWMWGVLHGQYGIETGTWHRGEHGWRLHRHR